MKKLIVIVSLLLCVACSNNNTMITYKEIIKLEDKIIVDIREKTEFKSGHILGAINIPLGEIKNSELDKNKTIIVYCRSGNRSNQAREILDSLGYEVYDLGSIDNWKGNIVEE